MLHAPAYGQTKRLAQQVCADFPDERQIARLTNELVHRLGQLGLLANRDSCNKALVLRMMALGRERDSDYFRQGQRPVSATPASATSVLALATVATVATVARVSVVAEPELVVEDEPPGEEQGYRVENECFTWASKKLGLLFRRRVADVDEMFYSYSVHGLNLSQVQMQHDFGLSNWEWNTLKARLMLQKQSNVFSAHTVQATPPAALEAMMEAKMARRYEKQGPLIERAHRNAAVKQLNRVLAAQNEREACQQMLIAELGDLLPTLRYRYIARAPQHVDGPAHLVFTVADPHVGAQVKRLLNAPRYDQAVLYQYADQLIARINARGAANVYLAGLGDYIESFTGMSHPNSWLQMDAQITRAGAVFAALEFLAYLVERIHNVREIWGVSGNHDRTSSNKKEDSRGEAAELLFGMLSQRYAAHGIAVHYRYDLLVRVVDGICYILGHSHLNMLANEKKALETIARHRVPGLYCVLISAHLHSRFVKLDSDDCRWVFTSSFFTGNDYSSQGGYATLPGYLTFENDGHNHPRVIDEPLSVGPFTPARLAA